MQLCSLHLSVSNILWNKKTVTLQLFSCLALFDSLRPLGLQPSRLLCLWDSPGKKTGVGCHALLQGIFPTQGSHPHCRLILYEGSPQVHTHTHTHHTHTHTQISQLPAFLLLHLTDPSASRSLHSESARPVVEPCTVRWHRASRRFKMKSAFLGFNSFLLTRSSFKVASFVLPLFKNKVCKDWAKAEHPSPVTSENPGLHLKAGWWPPASLLPFYSMINPRLQFLSAKNLLILLFERISLAHFVFPWECYWVLNHSKRNSVISHSFLIPSLSLQKEWNNQNNPWPQEGNKSNSAELERWVWWVRFYWWARFPE